ncbi:hypothetical protein ABPG72_001855 [Tetrahymena utriculariae]
MFRNILVSALNQKRQPLFQTIRRNFLTKNVDNSQELTQFLTETKVVDSKVFETFKTMIVNQDKVFIFKIHGLLHFFFTYCRYSVIALTLATMAHIGYYYEKKMEKYKENNYENRQKRSKINFATGALVLFTIGGNIISFIMGKRYLKSINYLPKTNQFEFNFYGFICQDKPYKVELNEVFRVQRKLLDQTVQFQIQNKNCPHTFFSSKGTGWWSNKKLFEYIVDQNKLSEMPKQQKIKKLDKQEK